MGMFPYDLRNHRPLDAEDHLGSITTTTTNDAATAGTAPFSTVVDIEKVQREIRIRELEAELKHKIEQEAARKAEVEVPFEDTVEFRDFVVWLCGYTDHESPPDQADWDKLRDRAKDVATKFALRVRAQREQKAMEEDAYHQPPLFNPTTTYTSSGSFKPVTTNYVLKQAK